MKNTKIAKTKTFSAAINWEWVHAHHPKSAGKVVDGPWLDRIISHAQSNGWCGTITRRGALRIVNFNLY